VCSWQLVKWLQPQDGWTRNQGLASVLRARAAAVDVNGGVRTASCATDAAASGWRCWPRFVYCPPACLCRPAQGHITVRPSRLTPHSLCDLQLGRQRALAESSGTVCARSRCVPFAAVKSSSRASTGEQAAQAEVCWMLVGQRLMSQAKSSETGRDWVAWAVGDVASNAILFLPIFRSLVFCAHMVSVSRSLGTSYDWSRI